MPRKGPAPRRELMPDPIYRSVVVTQLVNKVLQRGKRSTAERIVYDALRIVEEKTGSEPIATLKRALGSVDVVTKESRDAAFERSDVCAVAAASIVGEAMVATASPARMIHLEQNLANDGHLKALAAKARSEMSEPSRG